MEVDSVESITTDLKRKTGVTEPDVDPEKKAKMETTLSPEVDVEEEPITPEDIRKLKELLRQEEAKLMLIKRIKASIAIPEAKVPRQTKPITVKLPQSATTITNTTTNTTTTTVTVNGVANGQKTEKVKAEPVGQSGSKLEQVTQSFEKNKVRREELKTELNRTLNTITHLNPIANHDVNFFPTAANAEFLALLGLEKCVSRLKREEKSKSMEVDAYECGQCARDFSPSWKFDKEGRLLCVKCINTDEIKRRAEGQKGKFNEFSDFWKEKEVELKEIETQLEKDQKELRQQQIEAEKFRREKEAKSRQEKDRKFYGGVDKAALEKLMNSVNGNRNRPRGNNMGGASLLNQINQMTQEQTLQMIHRLHQMSNPNANAGLTGQQPMADYLANMKVQKIKEQMLQQQKDKQLETERRQAEIRKRKQQEELLRSYRQRQHQQQQAQQTSVSNPNSDLLRALSQIQTAFHGANSGATTGGASGSTQQQLQALTALLGAGQQQSLLNLVNANFGNRSPATNDRPNYAELLKPPTAHSNKR